MGRLKIIAVTTVLFAISSFGTARAESIAGFAAHGELGTVFLAADRDAPRATSSGGAGLELEAGLSYGVYSALGASLYVGTGVAVSHAGEFGTRVVPKAEVTVGLLGVRARASAGIAAIGETATVTGLDVSIQIPISTATKSRTVLFEPTLGAEAWHMDEEPEVRGLLGVRISVAGPAYNRHKLKLPSLNLGGF